MLTLHRWALKPPHFVQEWHVGVRVKESGKLVGFISGIPATMRTGKTVKELPQKDYAELSEKEKMTMC